MNRSESGHEQREERAQPLTYGICAALCFLCSAGVVLVVAGVFDVQKYAPDWILWIVAGTYLLFGFALLISGMPGHRGLVRTRFVLGLAVLACFVILANWAAFGPGTRHATTSFSFFFVRADRRAGDLEGRIVPALGAILLDLIVLGGIVSEIRRSRWTRPGRQA